MFYQLKSAVIARIRFATCKKKKREIKSAHEFVF